MNNDNNKDLETKKKLEEQGLSDQFFASQKNMEERSNSNKIIWILVIIFVLIAAALAWYLNGLKSDLSTEKTETVTPKSVDDSATDKQVTADSIADQSEMIEAEQSYQETADTSEKSVEDSDTAHTETHQEDSSSNESAVSTDDLHYFIISGAFSSEENAQKKVVQLSNAGHNAIIVGKNKAGLYMVAYDGYQDIQSAKTALKEIRNTQKSAWIYKK